MTGIRRAIVAVFSRAEKTLLAFAVVAVWAYAQHLMLTEGLPKTLPEPVAGRMLGILDGALLLVLHHFFSSTSRSELKDETSRELTAALAAKKGDGT